MAKYIRRTKSLQIGGGAEFECKKRILRKDEFKKYDKLHKN